MSVMLRKIREVEKMGLKEKSRTSKLGGKPTSIHAFGGLSGSGPQPVLAVALSLILFVTASLLIVPYAKAADPGHAASSISSGQFESGDFIFPSNLTVTKFFIANGTTLYVDAINGRVGIGTTSPSAALTVNSSSGAGSLQVQNTTGASHLFVNGTTGNVGIGTASPSSKLEVNGNVELTNLYDNDGSNFFDLSSCGDNTYISSIDSTGAVTCSADSGAGDVTGVTAGYGITVDNSGGPTPQVNISSSAAGDGLSYSAGVLAVNAGDGLGTSSDNVIVNMLAGGGIVTSSDSLSLNRSCGSGQLLKWNSGSSYWYCADDTGGGGNSTEEMQDAVGGAFDTTLNYTDASNLMGLNRTWLNNSGISNSSWYWGNFRVSSGACSNVCTDADTTCSSAACTVGSDDTLTSPTVGGNLDMGSTYYITNIGHANTDFTTGGGLTLNGNFSVLGTGTHTIAGNSNFDGNTLFVNASTHYVGIGTASPTSSLTINSSNSYGGFEVTNSTGSSRFFVNASSGKVSIGTNDPTFGLGTALNSKFSVANYDTAIAAGYNSTIASFALNPNSNGSFTIYDHAAGSWQTGINQNSGKVGIGTANPSKKLEVSDGTKAITFDPAASTPTINTTASYNLTITSSGGNVIILLG